MIIKENRSELSKLMLIISLCSVLPVLSACQQSESEQSPSIKVTQLTPPQSGENSNPNLISSSDQTLLAGTTSIDSASSLSPSQSVKRQSITTGDKDNMGGHQSEGSKAITVNDIADNDISTDSSDTLTLLVVTPETTYPLTSKVDPNVEAETQVTDVEYKNNSGQSIQVTFQTSAVKALEANLMLPSGNRVLLTAPPGQGNNPIYASEDGTIELVTHGGGSLIDLRYKGKLNSYEAVKAKAAVLKPK